MNFLKMNLYKTITTYQNGVQVGSREGEVLTVSKPGFGDCDMNLGMQPDGILVAQIHSEFVVAGRRRKQGNKTAGVGN